MFEARLLQANLLKKILEAIKDLVESANFDCSPEGISLQAMDTTHVTLINLVLRSDGFESYNCDRSLSLGLSLVSLSKILKCAGNDDALTIKARDNEADTVTFVFESPKNDRVSDFEVKLLDIKNEQYTIRNSEYSSVIKMPSSELQRICRDLSVIGEIVTISSNKDGVKFSVSGDSGSGNITVRPTTDSDVSAEQATVIESKEPVVLNFALKFLSNFTKATPLSPTVVIKMSEGIPVVVEYKIEDLGYLGFFLAPKIE
ncbi:proliferating cell nuclear antigen [Dictyostelium purpureum]|uniref:DNA sliding clamp PCNA n=1 Tax=Dictyostelium purpureum TaxID=5786 RepID=F0ZIM8_DICPU|nr:proliferating cell nuclear antigen [Dictyostelium purpureum]EGC36194.1 proliferating cell nuclear antigen [Dictyostelium purpureum]|eukprot:XP_003287261.1 proliferating cell nuclear antigen [Dictyostelium purpureum]